MNKRKREAREQQNKKQRTKKVTIQYTGRPQEDNTTHARLKALDNYGVLHYESEICVSDVVVAWEFGRTLKIIHALLTNTPVVTEEWAKRLLKNGNEWISPKKSELCVGSLKMKTYGKDTSNVVGAKTEILIHDSVVNATFKEIIGLFDKTRIKAETMDSFIIITEPSFVDLKYSISAENFIKRLFKQEKLPLLDSCRFADLSKPLFRVKVGISRTFDGFYRSFFEKLLKSRPECLYKDVETLYVASEECPCVERNGAIKRETFFLKVLNKETITEKTKIAGIQCIIHGDCDGFDFEFASCSICFDDLCNQCLNQHEHNGKKILVCQNDKCKQKIEKHEPICKITQPNSSKKDTPIEIATINKQSDTVQQETTTSYITKPTVCSNSEITQTKSKIQQLYALDISKDYEPAVFDEPTCLSDLSKLSDVGNEYNSEATDVFIDFFN
jgi:hypothetical protein